MLIEFQDFSGSVIPDPIKHPFLLVENLPTAC